MARIPGIEKKEDLADSHHAVYEAIAQSRGQVRGPFTMLLHSPELAQRVSDLGAYVRFASPLDPKLKELIILTVARELDCQFEWSFHTRYAEKAGVERSVIDAIHDRRDPIGLPRHETNVLRFVSELLRTRRVDGTTFDEVRRELGERILVELTAFVGYYAMLACVLNAFEVEPAPGTRGLED